MNPINMPPWLKPPVEVLAPKKKNAKIGGVMKDINGYMKWEEIQKVINAATNDRDKMLMMSLAYTGRRVSEVLKMTPRGILWDENMGVFEILKKRKFHQDRFPMNPKLLYALKGYIMFNRIKEDERLFDISRQHAYRIVRKAGKEVGLEHVGDKWIHPHLFRHSFAIQYLRVSDDPAALKKLQDILCHTDISMTSEYMKFNREDLREGIERM